MMSKVSLGRSTARRGVSLSKRERGFTLIELMIVVVIIGVLSSLAIYGVNNYIQQSKVTEAREVIASISAGQEGYFDETGAYLDVSGGLGIDNFYPSSDFNGMLKIQWGATTGCTGGNGETCADNFKMIGVMVNNPVMFRYATTTYAAGAGPAFGGWADLCEGGTDGKAGYVVVARSDLDNDGSSATVVVSSRMQADQCDVSLGD